MGRAFFKVLGPQFGLVRLRRVCGKLSSCTASVTEWGGLAGCANTREKSNDIWQNMLRNARVTLYCCVPCYGRYRKFSVFRIQSLCHCVEVFTLHARTPIVPLGVLPNVQVGCCKSVRQRVEFISSVQEKPMYPVYAFRTVCSFLS